MTDGDSADDGFARPPLSEDERLALEYLSGRLSVGDDGEFSHSKLDGAEEEAARQALVRVLESEGPLWRRIRITLATLIDSNPDSFNERQLDFRPRSRKPGEKGLGRFMSREVAGFVAELVSEGRQLKYAMLTATEKFDVSLSTVERAWRKNQNDDLVRYHLQQAGRKSTPRNPCSDDLKRQPSD